MKDRPLPTAAKSPKNLERRPSVKQQPPGHWVDAVRAMTKGGKLDTLPRPLPEGASRLRVKLYERRLKEATR